MARILIRLTAPVHMPSPYVCKSFPAMVHTAPVFNACPRMAGVSYNITLPGARVLYYPRDNIFIA